LNEYGIRFHRAITDHVFKFEYNIAGGLMMLQDISEYKKCSKKFRSSVVEQFVYQQIEQHAYIPKHDIM
ncbi:unnamed protein product, partial [Didymodactylos carnosus]